MNTPLLERFKKVTSVTLIFAILFGFMTPAAFAAGSLVANQTVANVADTKASRTLTVSAVPANGETITIGTCVVTFDNGTGETNCSDNIASIKRNGGETTATIAANLRLITNLSDAAHGALSVSGSGTSAIFTTAGSETSNSNITFTNATGGDVTNPTTVTGVVGTAQVVTFTPASPVDGETFRVTINSTNYDHIISGAETIQDVVEALQPLADADPAVTCTEDDTKVTCTASAPGTSFTYGATVIDTAAPVITLTGTTPVTVEVGSVYTDAGATASDNVDGDRTANIITVNPVNANVVGSYVVTYNVSDIAGNAATQVTRTVDVVDTTAPVISLVGSPTVSVNFGASYTDAGATASDNYDGDITGSIVTDNPVDTGTIGNYIVTYDVTDANGNAATQVTRSVDVVDVTAPVIGIIGDNPMTIEVGGTYTEPGANAVDDVDGTFAATPSGSVDTNTVGTYTIDYDATDTSSNAATQVTRTVNVVDTTVPVLTLLGITPTDTEWGQVYTDAGATASDNYDGDITADIIVVNPVNTLVIGIYTVTYNVADDSGNDAVEISRTVNVVDTTGPIISESTPVPTPTSDDTPDYTFTSNEAGSITYGGSCTAASFASATIGSNTITFDTLSDGTYSDCTITVTDTSTNVSNVLAVSAFTIDSTISASVGGSIDPNAGIGTPPTPPTPTPTPVPVPVPTPVIPTPVVVEITPTPTPETPAPTPVTPPAESDEVTEPNTPEPTPESVPNPPAPTPAPNPAPTPGTGGTGTTPATGTDTFNPADATLDIGGGTEPDATTTVEEGFDPADATLDQGG